MKFGRTKEKYIEMRKRNTSRMDIMQPDDEIL